jgi:putative FmdB family regulatory protein
MPTYVYKCAKCGHSIEVRHGFDEKGPKTCRRNGCRGKLERVFTPPAIIFKGKGFHVTDYGRGNGKKPAAARESGGGNGKSAAEIQDKAKETAEQTAAKLDE